MKPADKPSSLARRLRIFGRDDANVLRAGAPLCVSWESALERLSRLPRMFVEPDGSFLWNGDDKFIGHWQLEGTVYDDGRVVRTVELLGHCSLDNWQTFLEAFETTCSSIIIELVDENRIVAGEWLREYAQQVEDNR